MLSLLTTTDWFAVDVPIIRSIQGQVIKRLLFAVICNMHVNHHKASYKLLFKYRSNTKALTRQFDSEEKKKRTSERSSFFKMQSFFLSSKFRSKSYYMYIESESRVGISHG